MQTFVVDARDLGRREHLERHQRLLKALASLPFQRWERWLPASYAFALLGFLAIVFSLEFLGLRPSEFNVLLWVAPIDIGILFSTAVLAGAAKKREVFILLALCPASFVAGGAVIMLLPGLIAWVALPMAFLSCMLYLEAMRSYARSRCLDKTASGLRRIQSCSTLYVLVGVTFLQLGPQSIIAMVAALCGLVCLFALPWLALRTCLVWHRELSAERALRA